MLDSLLKKVIAKASFKSDKLDSFFVRLGATLNSGHKVRYRAQDTN